MRIEDLSVNERILIHLRDQPMDPETEGAVLGQTQEGIGAGVGIRINHVPRATNSLMEDGYIGEALMHIGGLKRKGKAFFLTKRGREKADGLIRSLREQKVPFRDSDGNEGMHTVQEILFKSKTAKPSDIILSVFREGVALEKSDQEASNFISYLDSVPDAEHFVNRKEEMSKLREWIDSDARIVVVSGIKGIGKTAFVRKAMEAYLGKRNILWYTAHSWDTPRAFVEQISEMYVRLGRNEARKVLRQSKEIDISQASMALIKDMDESSSILVIDNVFNNRKDAMQLMHMLCEQSARLHGSTLILITRDNELVNCVPSHRGSCRKEIDLRGLDRDSAMELMHFMGMEPEDGDRVFAMTQGHPLAIKLVNSDEVMKVIDTKGLTKEEVWVVKCMKAFNAIFSE